MCGFCLCLKSFKTMSGFVMFVLINYIVLVSCFSHGKGLVPEYSFAVQYWWLCYILSYYFCGCVIDFTSIHISIQPILIQCCAQLILFWTVLFFIQTVHSFSLCTTWSFLVVMMLQKYLLLRKWLLNCSEAFMFILC